MRNTLALGAAALLGSSFIDDPAHAQCPAYGSDTDCGAVITITATGATVTSTGQGPYDGSDDTLIGVVNNIPACTGSNSRSPCGLSIASIDLQSPNPIFAFDLDGIVTYGAPGNPLDPTGYGGPNAYFSNISADTTSGRVNFITPIPPGGTAYFSLENVLAASQACSDILNNSIPAAPTLMNGNTGVTNPFTPQGNDPNTTMPYTLSAAATACGFLAFDWQSTITNLPAPSPAFAVGAPTTPLVAPPPFNDPPLTGYTYQQRNGGVANAVQIPVYYNVFITGQWWSLGNAANTNTAGTQLTFQDFPLDPCLPGTQSPATAALADSICGGAGVRAPAGSTINFTTHVVGLQGQALSGAQVVDTGVGFTWNTTYNGTTGGIAVLGSNQPPDPGSGTGGITVTGVNQTTTYTGVGVTGLNGSSNPFAPTSLLTAVLPASRSAQPSGTVTAFETVINTGTATATGCSIAPANGLPVTFDYQATNPATNQVIGSPDTPVSITAGGSQSFVVAIAPTADIAPTNFAFNVSCDNTSPAPIVTGLNTLLLSASTATPTPDVVALGATAQNDGIVHVTGTPAAGAFAVATVNLGAADTITVAANTGAATLPVSIALCQTNSSTGQCLAPAASSVTATIASNATPTFAVFVSANATIPLDPANSRIFVTFTDSTSAVRGETSVAIETQ
jgi:hypothetical protein